MAEVSDKPKIKPKFSHANMRSFKCGVLALLDERSGGRNMWTRDEDLMDKGHWKSWNAA